MEQNHPSSGKQKNSHSTVWIGLLVIIAVAFFFAGRISGTYQEAKVKTPRVNTEPEECDPATEECGGIEVGDEDDDGPPGGGGGNGNDDEDEEDQDDDRDDPGGIKPADYSNNHGPDLHFSFAQTNPLKLSKVGQTIYLLATVENQGNFPTGNFVVKVMKDANLLQPLHTQTISQLNPGEFEYIDVDIVETQTGPHNLQLIIDPENRVKEINENNNIRYKYYQTYKTYDDKEVVTKDVVIETGQGDVPITSRGIDLFVKDYSTDIFMRNDGKKRLNHHITIANQGSIAMRQDEIYFVVEVKNSNQTEWVPADHFDKLGYIPTVTKGATKTVSTENGGAFTLPQNPNGNQSFDLRVKLDVNETLHESDITNNIAIYRFTYNQNGLQNMTRVQ